ncbi:ATPase family protein associated with various cellular activities (AAA) [Streptomyces sp. 2132.2]|nr:ATPase family protein associated with various cellular activities (AAA) [Streptomyces sp. 2132.2]
MSAPYGSAPGPETESTGARQDAVDDPGIALLARLGGLRARVSELVERRAAGDPTADDPLRGLYLSDDAVRHLLRSRPAVTDDGTASGTAAAPGTARAGAGAGTGGATGHADRLARLAARASLTELDVAVLLIALAPDVDRTFEPLYGYLNDDVSRRRATVGLALDLCGVPAHSASARARLHAGAPLAALGLLEVEDPERPFLTRSLRVPDRLVGHLLGDDTPDTALLGLLRPMPEPLPPATADEWFTRRLVTLLESGTATVYLREQREGDGLAAYATALRAAGLDALCCAVPGEHVAELLREARLSGRAVVVPALPERPGPLVRALAAAPDVTVLLADPRPYDPHWCPEDPLVLDAPARRDGGTAAWMAALGADGAGFDLAATVAPYRLGGDRVRRAAQAARELAAFDGSAVTAAHVRRAARRQSVSGLESRTRRIRPAVDWGDLVLPDGPLGQLRELALRARHRERVLGDWRLSAGGGRGRGVLGLFAGESGTGKTLSAEVVAADLGLDLYVVQLSSVVDKYVGETEKNLEGIFTEADRTDAVLLFDEADAVFGKRSEVRGAHDRYANMESAYLLQRLESFGGIALLTTNLRANIDEAFTRRLDLVVDFPFPDAGQRLALWRHGLAHVPSADGIDAAPLARDFELAGGSIRSAVVTAAYRAAGRGGEVTADDLLEGARREYRKAGRLVPGEGGW